MQPSADAKRVNDMTVAILMPWAKDALQLVHESLRQAKQQLEWIKVKGEKEQGPMPLARQRLESFIARAESVLKAASE